MLKPVAALARPLVIAASTLLCSALPLMAQAQTVSQNTVSQNTVSQNTVPQNMDIYLLMGQSNMSGRGHLEDLPDAAKTASGIWLYGNDGVWRQATEPLDNATGQIDPVSGDGDKAGVGPGLSFARTLPTPENSAIALVPCAKGGSSLSQWTPNPDRTRLYGSCMARAREASAKGRIAGVLWYQGETDAEKPEATALWPERMVTLVAQVRHDLGDTCLPWVIVGLSDQPDPQKWPRPTVGWAEVQAAQKALPAKIVRLGYVSAASLAHNGDDIHLNTASQLILGPQLAKEMQRVKSMPCV